MAFDGLVVRALTQELSDLLVGGRINKIYQPLKQEVHMIIRCLGENHRLLISVAADQARFHLTKSSKENPQKAPLFCMVLRKHLEGGKIISIEQLSLDRIVKIKIEAYDELGRLSQKDLLIEIMGKHSNLILIEPESNIIIDGLKRYTHAVSQHREVLPGKEYIAPPAQNKFNPLDLKESDLIELIYEADEKESVAKVLQQKLDGLSPQSCKELLSWVQLPLDFKVGHCGQLELSKLWKTIVSLQEILIQRCFRPSLFINSKQGKIYFSAIPLTQYGLGIIEEGSMNAITDKYFFLKLGDSKIKSKQTRLSDLLQNELQRLTKRQDILNKDLETMEEAEKYKLWAELLTANIYRLEKGQTEIALENYYDPNWSQIVIPLDPQLTPSAMIQSYYKKYNKGKARVNYALAELEKLNLEVTYLDTVLDTVERSSSVEDLEEVEEELRKEGYIKEKTLKRDQKNTGISKPWKILSPLGYTIYIGRNNQQNDYLTIKIAQPEDWWFHTKDIPGSHIVVKLQDGQNLPAQALEDASQLAVFFSKGKDSSKVPVDYTQRKNIRKPKGSKPGMVIYEGQQTLYITPDLDFIEELLSRKE